MKKTTTVLAMIIGAVLGLYFLFLFLILNKKQQLNQAEVKTGDSVKTVALAPEITEAKPDSLPEGFPEIIPLAKKIKIIKSYSAVYPNSAAKQATVVFESGQAMKSNYDYYTGWAKANGWQIVNQADTEALKFIYLKKGVQADLNITITKTSDKAKAEVSLSYVKF